jgi:hypothetical protein
LSRGNATQALRCPSKRAGPSSSYSHGRSGIREKIGLPVPEANPEDRKASPPQ